MTSTPTRGKPICGLEPFSRYLGARAWNAINAGMKMVLAFLLEKSYFFQHLLVLRGVRGNDGDDGIRDEDVHVHDRMSRLRQRLRRRRLLLRRHCSPSRSIMKVGGVRSLASPTRAMEKRPDGRRRGRRRGGEEVIKR